MLVDQHFSRGVDVTFFGRRCKANPSIARLARQFDCPVVGVRVIRLPGHRFRIAAEGPFDLPRDASGRIDVQQFHADDHIRDRALGAGQPGPVAVVSPSLAVMLTGMSWQGAPPRHNCGTLRSYERQSQMGRRVPMRSLALSFTILAGLAGAPVLAQTGVPVTPQGVPPGANPATGARPGNDIGTGMSMPMGTRASNIDAADTRSVIAPNLPSPPLDRNASAADYLRAAQTALQADRTGEAQQSLEMAQTRLLDRSVPMGQTNNPSDNPAVTQVSQALRALAAGDRAQTMQLIQSAIPAAMASTQ